MSTRKLAIHTDRPVVLIRVILIRIVARGHTVMSTISEKEPEDPLDRWRREKAEREEPQPRERRLDTAQFTLDDIDRRIEDRVAAEHEFMMGILTELLAQIQSDPEMRGPPGSAGPRGEQGPPGKLPLVKLWMPETVYYEGDVVAYDGGTYQARRDTGQPPSHTDCPS
jgi:hypothetical protein